MKAFEELFPGLVKYLDGKGTLRIRVNEEELTKLLGNLNEGIRKTCVDKQKLRDFIAMMERTYKDEKNSMQNGLRYCIERLKEELKI